MVYSGMTVALPPPWVRALAALSPITATERRLAGSHGSSLRFSSSTVPSTAACRAKAIPSSTQNRVGGGEPVERTDPARQGENTGHLAVDGRLGDLAGADGPHQGLGPGSVRAGHDQVLRGPGAFQRPDGGPVADHYAVEAPLAVQRGLQQVALGRGGAVDRVVRAHHEPGVCLGDGLLEREQVQLAKSAVTDLDVDREAVGLGVVGHVMLRCSADAVVLHAFHVGGGEIGGEHGILAECLEVPSAERGAVQVDGRAEHHVDALAAGLHRGRGAIAPGDVRIPGRRERGGGREVERRIALIPGLAPDARRAVGDQDATQTYLPGRPGGPEISAREQLDLLLQAERGERFGDLRIGG